MKPKVPVNATVKFSHFRRTVDGIVSGNMQYMRSAHLSVNPRGGATYARVLTEDGRVYTGVAVCSWRDNFCKATGRNIALGRALKQMEEDA